MTIDKDFLLKALLQRNYLPNQKESPEEMPPIFSSDSFTESVARELVANGRLGKRKRSDYDSVEYKLTRFDGVTRNCSIPHPTAYSNLALSLHENWGKLNHISDNEVSMIRPQKHPDGRIIVMDYGESVDEYQIIVDRSFGKRFEVHTDIANFFPSIYSHAIPWALVGLCKAKKHRSLKHWFNKIDQAVRMTKRGETQGIAIGPATSNIISELILKQVDNEMEKKKFTFFRHIDDYTAFCETHERAQDFISTLSTELAKFKLSLNASKTEILDMPRQFIPDWILSLTTALPKKEPKVSPHSVISYLNIAVSLARQSPDGSVLKYALKSIKGSAREEIANLSNAKYLLEKLDADCNVSEIFQESSVKAILDYSLNLAFYQPALVSYLEDMLEAAYLCQSEFQYAHQIRALVAEYARLRYSDAVSWALYYSIKYNVPIEKCSAKRIIETRDCVPILLLYLSGAPDYVRPNYVHMVVDFANKLDKDYPYGLDSLWLLLYQLFLDGKIDAPYQNDDAFKVMRDNGVSFVRQDLLQTLLKRRI